MRALAFTSLALLGLAFAANPYAAHGATLALCFLFNTLFPIAAMAGIVLSGVVFAAGQMMGAETRARANVWATNLLIGSLIAGVLTVVAPWLTGTILGEEGKKIMDLCTKSKITEGDIRSAGLCPAGTSPCLSDDGVLLGCCDDETEKCEPGGCAPK